MFPIKRGFGFLLIFWLPLFLLTGFQALAQSGTLVLGQDPDDPIAPRHIYAVTQAGVLLLYIDASTDTVVNWTVQAVVTPAIPGVNWATDFKLLFPGGDGVIYGVRWDGHLVYFRLIDPWRNAVSLSWSVDSNTVIGEGFNIFSTGTALSRLSDTATTLSRSGALWFNHDQFYLHSWRDGGLVDPDNYAHGGSAQTLASVGPPTSPGCQSCVQVFEAGDGISYAVETQAPLGGILRRYRVHARSDTASELIVGNGWVFPFVFAEPGSYQIEGYVSTAQALPNSTNIVSTLSVLPGDMVRVRASTFSPSYTARLLRLQRHFQSDATTASGVIDGVQVGDAVTVEAPAGGNFKKRQDTTMYSTGANWPGDGADVLLPANAPSGVYAVELTTPSGGRYLAPFIVKPGAAQPRKIAVIANVNTWNAYNEWGGQSRYSSVVTPELVDTEGQAGFELSFERPLQENPFGGSSIPVIGLLSRDSRPYNHLVRAELWVNTWLDQLAAADPNYGYDVYTDVDLDVGIPCLGSYKALLIHTHPEYWSERMLDHLEGWLAGGGHLVYMGGNGLYDRVTITNTGLLIAKGIGGNCTGGPADPCPPRDLLRFASPAHPEGRSERMLLGSAYETFSSFVGLIGARFVVTQPHSFLTDAAGTGLVPPNAFGDVSGLNHELMADGWEVQEYLPDCRDFSNHVCTTTHTILTGTRLATADGLAGDVVFVPRTNGAWVFSIGSIPVGGVLAINPTMQRIVRNALDAALATCAPWPDGVVAWWPAEGSAADAIGGQGGTLFGNVSFTPGRVGQAFRFNGSAGCVILPPGVFPFPGVGTGHAPFTFETWFETTSTTGGVILGQQDGAPYGAPFGAVPAIYVSSGGFLQVEMFWKGSIGQINSAKHVNDGVFHHVAVVYDGTNETVYLDGALMGSAPHTQTAYGGSGTYQYQLGTGTTVGAWPGIPAGWLNFVGLIDEPSVYGRALTAAEVRAIYSAGSFGKCPRDQFARFTSITLDSGLVRLPFAGNPGFRYQLQAGDFLDGTWTNIDCPQVANPVGQLQFAEPPQGLQRFFRALQLP